MEDLNNISSRFQKELCLRLEEEPVIEEKKTRKSKKVVDPPKPQKVVEPQPLKIVEPQKPSLDETEPVRKTAKQKLIDDCYKMALIELDKNKEYTVPNFDRMSISELKIFLSHYVREGLQQEQKKQVEEITKTEIEMPVIMKEFGAEALFNMNYMISLFVEGSSTTFNGFSGEVKSRKKNLMPIYEQIINENKTWILPFLNGWSQLAFANISMLSVTSLRNMTEEPQQRGEDAERLYNKVQKDNEERQI